VAVVAAGVHHAVHLGGMGRAGILLYRQRVHVHAQEQRPALPSGRFRHYPRAAEAGAHLQGRPLQERLDPLRRAPLLPRQLGMTVQVAPQGDDLVAQGEDFGRQAGHGRILTG
jgi:hypothetical protein